MPLLAPVTITLRPVRSGMSVVLKVVMDNNVDTANNAVNDNFVRRAPAYRRLRRRSRRRQLAAVARRGVGGGRLEHLAAEVGRSRQGEARVPRPVGRRA